MIMIGCVCSQWMKQWFRLVACLRNGWNNDFDWLRVSVMDKTTNMIGWMCLHWMKQWLCLAAVMDETTNLIDCMFLQWMKQWFWLVACFRYGWNNKHAIGCMSPVDETMILIGCTFPLWIKQRLWLALRFRSGWNNDYDWLHMSAGARFSRCDAFSLGPHSKYTIGGRDNDQTKPSNRIGWQFLEYIGTAECWILYESQHC